MRTRRELLKMGALLAAPQALRAFADEPRAQTLLILGGTGFIGPHLTQEAQRRGWRVAMTDAPLKETLAAAVLALGGVTPDRPFVDPMAGGGTLAIEHALAARGIPPGLRRRFGFERWPAFLGDEAGRAAWERTRAEAEQAAMAPREPLPPIVCADVSPDALGAWQKAEIAKWWPIIKAADVKVD